MAIIVGRRDKSPLISSAGPVAVPDKTPTQEFAQGIQAAAMTYSLGRKAFVDANKLATVGVNIKKGIDRSDAKEERQKMLKDAEERNYQMLFDEWNAQQHAKWQKSQAMSGAGGTHSAPAKDMDEIQWEQSDVYKNMGEGVPQPKQTAKTSTASTVLPTAQVTNIPSGKTIYDRTSVKSGTQRTGVSTSAPPQPFIPTSYTASSWKELQDREAGVTPESEVEIPDEQVPDRLRALARQRAREEVGGGPVTLADIRTRAMAAATITDFKVRAEVTRDILESFDRSDGEGIPVQNWWEVFSGEHIIRARKEVEKMLSMTPEMASKIRAYQAQQAASIAAARKSRRAEVLDVKRGRKLDAETVRLQQENRNRPQQQELAKIKASLEVKQSLVKLAQGKLDYKKAQILMGNLANMEKAKLEKLLTAAGLDRAKTAYYLGTIKKTRKTDAIRRDLIKLNTQHEKDLEKWELISTQQPKDVGKEGGKYYVTKGMGPAVAKALNINQKELNELAARLNSYEKRKAMYTGRIEADRAEAEKRHKSIMAAISGGETFVDDTDDGTTTNETPGGAPDIMKKPIRGS